ncbi:hypothetical protein NGM37_49190, partial [Streptomyces sp. TRM76130]|nr:hypothetical protein [Streptomyces sp. TRM76130]
IDTLAASGEKVLLAIRSARSVVRQRVWSLTGENAPDAYGQVTVDLVGVLVDTDEFTRRSMLRTPPVG